MSNEKPQSKAISLRDQIDGLLTTSGYRYKRTGNTETCIRYNLGMALKIGQTDLFILCHLDRGLLEIVSRVSFSVPEKSIKEVSLYLHEVNLRMNVGHFDFDISQGSIQSRTSILLKDLELEQEVFEKSLYLNLNVIEDFIPGVMAVIHADMDSSSALQKILDDINNNSKT
jgi:hypothetical protein